MIDTLVVLLFGFPAVFRSLLVSVIGVWKDKFWLVIAGALMFMPFSYLLPLFQILSAAAVREQNKLWAWLLLAPAFLATFWVVGVILLYQIS